MGFTDWLRRKTLVMWRWSRASLDCHILWLHGIPAVGIPGASNWREERDARHFDGIESIYVVIEPDRGGDTVKKWLSRSTIRQRARLLSLPAKDPSALYLQGPEEFARRWQVACLGAIPWSAVEAEANAAERTEAWGQCSGLWIARRCARQNSGRY
jgi:hypothetical protein